MLLLLPRTLIGAIGQDPTPAETNLQQGRVDAALAEATTAIAQNPKDPGPHFLICRARYHLEQWPAAADACRQAIALDGQDARYHLWLGRALGEQAERASLLTAYSLARQLRVEFETAARLSPRNADVLSDLGEFYAEAPGILGGGADKARAIATQLGQVDPVASHWLQAEIARSRKDYDLAERELHLAIETSTTPAQAWMNLASFYRDRKRLEEMETAVKAGAAADSQSSSALVDGANTLLRAGRNTPLAIDLLQRYLRGGHLSEDAPAFAVHARLAQALEQQGDTAGAAKERLAMRALAQEYVEPPPGKH
jgi:tetratricopeptide (TPR) repeat protein